MQPIIVSIPSNGSIQFLLWMTCSRCYKVPSQSPQTGQFNSYNMDKIKTELAEYLNKSQSPQTGQFNSYDEKYHNLIKFLPNKSQSPQTGQFNSYRLSHISLCIIRYIVSIPSNGSIQFLRFWLHGKTPADKVSIPSNGSIQFLLRLLFFFKKVMEVKVSIPSNGSIQFLQKRKLITI